MIVLTSESCHMFTKIKYAEVFCKLQRTDFSFALVHPSGTGQRVGAAVRAPVGGGGAGCMCGRDLSPGLSQLSALILCRSVVDPLLLLLGLAGGHHWIPQAVPHSFLTL